MKTKSTKTKSNILKLTKVFFIAALMSLGLKANAQCLANYNSTVDPANNGDVAFVNTSSSSTSVNYYWSFGDGAYSTAMNPGTHNYASSGTYTVCLTINDSLGMYDSILGCYSSYCTMINVINGASSGTCTALFTPFDSAGYGYFWNQSTGTGLTSTWTFGDGTSATGTGDITHLYASPGTYTVCLTISNFLGTCTDTYCDSVTIGTSSGTCHAYFVSNDSVSFTQFYDYSTGIGPLSYVWSFGDGGYSTTSGDQTHTYASPGTYNVCLTISDTGTCSNTFCSYVTISAPIIPCDASFTPIQDSTNIYNYFIYMNSAGSAGDTYLWSFGDGTSSTLQYPSHTYAGSGPYYLCLTVTNGFLGCTATYCDSITAGLAMMSPLTINVVNPTGIQEEENTISSLENYPNPFNSSTTISYTITQDANVELSIMDLLGNKVAEIEHDSKAKGSYTSEWNAANISEGMYLMQLKVNNNTSTKKIIITR